MELIGFLPFRENIFALYGQTKEIFGTWFSPCPICMSGTVSLCIRDSLHFKGCDYIFGSVIS